METGRRFAASIACLLLSPALAIAAGNAVAPAQRGLPQRNLLVELRQVQDASGTITQGHAGGSVTIRSDGTITGGGQGSVTTSSRDAIAPSVQQLLVLNGGRGAMRLSQAIPYQFVDVGMSPQGPVVSTSTVWRDTGTGFTVQPRWPGGQAPVTVELSAEAGEASLLTTLQLPLGEWVTIARSATESDMSRRYVLQMRISAP